MTAISDHCDAIRGWLNFDYPDALIISWTRMAEESLSELLRCKHMIAIDYSVINQKQVLLPADWLELDFVRLENGVPLLFKSRDRFFADESCGGNAGHYTIVGNYLLIGGTVENGVPVQLSYYEQIPPLGEISNWLYTFYSRLYVASTLSVASAYSMQDDRAVMWEASAQKLIDQINDNSVVAKTSGSKMLIPRFKGFG